MQLHDIKPLIKKKKMKRLGRGPGSGRGKTSGRGHKGAKSRSGPLHYIGHEGDNVPYFRKIPKRGFSPKTKKEFQIVNVQELQMRYTAKGTVSNDSLYAAGIIKKKEIPVKILGKGAITKAVVVKVAKC